jgi:phospholipase C
MSQSVRRWPPARVRARSRTSSTGAPGEGRGQGPDTGPGGSDTVSVIDTASDKVTGTFTVGQAPQMIVASPDGRRAYVTCSQGVYAIDARHGHGRGHRLGSACAGAHGLAVSHEGTLLYVADAERDQLVVLDAGSGEVVRRVAVGRMPWGVALTSDGAAVYVTNANSDTVSVYSAVPTTIAFA